MQTTRRHGDTGGGPSHTDPAEWVAALDDLKRQRGLVRAGEPIPSYSLGLPAPAIARLQAASAGVVEALAKVAHRILHGHPAFPSLGELGFTKQKAAVLGRALPETPRDALVIGRLDVSTDGERFHAYELNGSQPGGMEFLELFDEPMIAARFPRPAYDRLFPTYLENALRFYRRKTGREAPRGVLVLAHGYHLAATQRAVYERCLGQPVALAEDGASCRYDGRELLFRDAAGKERPIDLVLRSPRASFERLLERANTPLLRAHGRGHLVIVNPLAAKLVGWKTLFALVHDPRLLDLAGVTDGERAAIRALVPPTVRVTAEAVGALEAERAGWVLKGTASGRGALVWLGPDVTPGVWRKQLARGVRQRSWVCQRYERPHTLDIRVHDLAGSVHHVPASVDPYVTVGEEVTVPAFLCRALVPVHGDPAERENVKLNLLGENRYRSAEGEWRTRQIGFGYVHPVGVAPEAPGS